MCVCVHRLGVLGRNKLGTETVHLAKVCSSACDRNVLLRNTCAGGGGCVFCVVFSFLRKSAHFFIMMICEVCYVYV